MFRSLVRVATAGVARAQAPSRSFTRSRLFYPPTIASQRFLSKTVVAKTKGNDGRMEAKGGKANSKYDDDNDNDSDESFDDEDEEDYDEEYDDNMAYVDGEDNVATVGDLVPDFGAQQVHPSGSSSIFNSTRDMEGRYTIMLFYPADFTFVCPTELTAFSDRLSSFSDVDCDVIGISTDQVHCHTAWMMTPRNQGGVKGLKFPLLADPTHEVTKRFGFYDDESGQARRATVIVNPHHEIVHTSVNLAPVGRSVDEALRLVEAFKFVDEHGDQVCPVNWKKGNKTMTPNHEEKLDYFQAVEKN